MIVDHANKLPAVHEILELLPHRNPFMLVDRITAVEPGLSITGVKSITFNEWYFQGLPPMLKQPSVRR